MAVPSEFAGRVLVAKLGSAGIIAEVRGVSRVYPTVFDSPAVWVEAAELDDARVLITADTDDELAADPHESIATGRASAIGPYLRPILVAVALALLVSLSFGPRSCSPAASTTNSRIP